MDCGLLVCTNDQKDGHGSLFFLDKEEELSKGEKRNKREKASTQTISV